jgi:glycosyltransferase involved in cell wall biosynthesis
VNRIRVALVASTLGVGGAERVTADVLELLPEGRFETRLYFLRDAGWWGRTLFERGLGGVERLRDGASHTTALCRLVRHFHAYRPDVVVCLDHHDAMTLGRLAGIVCGARGMVVASHATGLVGRKHVFGVGDRVLMDFTARVIAVSESHARYLRSREGLPASAVTIIENGVNLAEWPPVTVTSRRAARASLELGEDERVVLMVAAMRPEKAHDALLRAARMLRDAGMSATVLLAGDGELRATLEDRVRSLGIVDDVRFLGVRHDVARLLHASDAMVLPSLDVVETLPLAVIEAMAVGVPVVASAVGSIPELIGDGDTGFLVPPADAVAVAGRLGYIFKNPAQAQRIAGRGRDRVRGRYRIEATARRYEALFEELVAA